MLTVPSNIVAPSTLTFRVLSPLFGPDLTTVTAAALNVVRRDGTTAVWACAVVSATSREMVMQYAFSDTGEVTATGAYILTPALTLPGGKVPCESITLFVTAPEACQPQTETDTWVIATSLMGGAATHFDWATPVSSGTTLSPLFPYVPLDLRGGTIPLTLWAGTGGDTLTLADLYVTATPYTLTPTNGQAIYSGGTAHTGAVTLSGLTRLKYSSGLNAWLGV